MKTICVEHQSFKEPVSHGTNSFPLAWYADLQKAWQGFYFGTHWHGEIEILYVLAGQMELVVDNHGFILRPNSIVLIPPNVLHTAYQIKQEHCRFCSIVFSPDFVTSAANDKIQKNLLQPFLDHAFSASYVLLPGDEQQKLIQPLLRQFEQAYPAGNRCRELTIKGLILLVLAQLLAVEARPPVKTRSQKKREQRERKIITFIENHYHEKLSLAQMADAVELSKEQFNRFFKQAFRCSPTQYVYSCRLQQASYLLRQTDYSIIDIAHRTGFENSNYFAFVFKKNFGLSPTEFRKMT